MILSLRLATDLCNLLFGAWFRFETASIISSILSSSKNDNELLILVVSSLTVSSFLFSVLSSLCLAALILLFFKLFLSI